MVAFDPQSRHATRHHQQQNIPNWERALSTGAGIILTGLGLHRGGPTGLARIALGGLLLARGGTGHCNVKGLLDDPQQEIRHLRARMRQLSAALAKASENSGSKRARRSVEREDVFDATQIPGGTYAIDPATASRMSGRA